MYSTYLAHTLSMALSTVFHFVLFIDLSREGALSQAVSRSLSSGGVALGVNNIIGAIYHRDRPFLAHHVIQLIQHDASASFPSNHAAAAFAVATSIWLWRRKEGRVWFVLAILIGFSRIWSGIHYPLDIIGGAISGTVIGIAVNKIMRQQVLKKVSESVIRLYESIELKVWKP